MDDKPSLEQSLEELLGPDQTDDDEAFFEGARQSMRVRVRNSHNGANMLDELRRRGYSLREIEQRTGIPKSTIVLWATPPPKATT